MENEEKRERQKQQENETGQEVNAMTTAVKLQQSDKEYIEGMKRYLEELKQQPPEQAKDEAKKALIRTGVLTRNGKPKKTIVSWE